MADLWDAVRSTNEARFASVLEKVAWPEGSLNNVELLLSRCQMQQELRPETELYEFIQAGEEAIADACDFIHERTDLASHEMFLRKVARRSTKLPRTQIFTTNYDLAFEVAAARLGFAVIDGFTSSSPALFDPIVFERDFARREPTGAMEPIDWVPNVVQLHKLHGSIDWLAVAGKVRRGSPSKRPAIVYPRSSKFEVSYQQPFLELMGRFQAMLRRSGTGLLVAGSGFEDRHLAEPFMAAIRGNVGVSAIVVARSLEDKSHGVVGDIKKLIGRGDRRLSLIAGSFDDFVGELPDLVARMEGESHANRLASLDDD